MTLVEILMATLVLFFAITAVLGLIAASMRINVQSTQQVVAVNRVQSYIEDVRRMSYDEIGVVGGALPGLLPASSQFVESGYEVTITPTVTWVDDPLIEGDTNYKRLRVVAVSRPAGGGGRSYTYTAETYIRESDSNRPDDAAPPEMEFLTGSPEIMGIVSGTGVMVYAHAWSPMENGLLQNLRFYCDSRALRDSANPPTVAEWYLEDKDVTRSFSWDSTKIDEDGKPFSPDGVRQLKIQTWDNVGQTTYRIRQIIVDNYAPAAPGSLTATPKTDLVARLSWPYSLDGPTVGGIPYATDPAKGYTRSVYRESGGLWALFSQVSLGNVTACEHATTPFTRYRATIVAYSPSSPPLVSGPTATPRPYISRSRLRGTWSTVYTGLNTSRMAATTVNVTLSAPTFWYTTATNTLYRSLSPDMSDAVVVSTGGAFSGSDSYTTAVGKIGVPTPYYYQAVTTIKPAGAPDYASNPEETVKSNIIGPVGVTNAGTMATAGW